MPDPHRVVIIGGGFGGLRCAQALARAPVAVTVIDRRNFHLFQPLLYQVATGALSPANIAAPLRSVLKRQRNARVLLGEAVAIDARVRAVRLRDGADVPYDTLVVATGSRHHYFGHQEWEAFAPGLKTIEDATAMRRRIFLAFEHAERTGDVAERAALLTFVVVGGGPTGVELAGALAEIARHTMAHEFRAIDPAAARIILVEAGDRVLAPYDPILSGKAVQALTRIGVTVRTSTQVIAVRDDGVDVTSAGATETIPARTVLWGAGVMASPLGRIVAESIAAETDRSGRVMVEPDCSVAGHPEIFIVGDLANFSHDGGKPLPGVAQVAMQQGDHVARLIRSRLDGRQLPPFRYRDLGNMATIGKHLAVAEMGSLRLSGWLAWLAWLFIHVLKLVRFESRVLVLVQWAWYYVSWNRSARLITGDEGSKADSGGKIADSA